MKRSADSGNVLLLVCVLLLLVLVFILVVANQAAKDVERQAKTDPLLQQVYEAIVGNPDKMTFGYLGDIGDYPTSLMQLTTNPGVTGWNGPYINTVPLLSTSGSTMMLADHYNSPLEYFLNFANATTDQIAVISRGRDHSSTNTANNPNIDSQFAGTLPNSGTYGTANPDNEVYPDFVSDVNNLYRESVGTVTFNIRNYDQNASSNTIMAGCANLYSTNITSVPRGSSDTTTLAYPGSLYAQNLRAQLLQGLYDVEIRSLLSMGSIWRERIAILPGTNLQRDILAPRIDSNLSTSFNMIIHNNTSPGTAISIRNFSNNITSVLGSVASGARTTFSVKGCTQLDAQIGGVTVDSWIMPFGAYVRAIKQAPQTTYTLTVTNGGTNSDVIKVIQTGFQGNTTAAPLVIGTVYKRKTLSFTVPGTQNAGALPAGFQGVAIEIRTRTNSLIGPGTFSPAQTGIYTANTTFTVP